MDFSKGSFSPMFLSPGYRDNENLKPQIKTSLWAKSLDTLFHEAKHGLHFLVCVSIFRDPKLYKEAFSLFCENVLGDEDFIKKIEKRGTKLQREFIKQAYALRDNSDILSHGSFSDLAIVLGALTYQHAYFVDPRMCEAVASFKDIGFTKLVGKVNRSFSSLFPGDTALKGYGDIKLQSMFGSAGLLQKALLVRKNDYVRDAYFKQKE